ncbi:MAG TPA: transporter, partial [Candidatus Binataceae bacterium]|nr:transporter [Candidatus Binataceae bacterium]
VGLPGSDQRPAHVMDTAITKRLTLIAVVLIAVGASSSSLNAEEGGGGHYLPGATASFIDLMPDRETSTFAYLNAVTYYHGSAGASKQFELGGQIAANVRGTFYADTSFFLYQVPWELLGGQYGAGISVPYVWLDVNANLGLTGPRGRTLRREKAHAVNGFGDVEILPLMFGWKLGDFKWQTTFGIYSPTGSFARGALANIGKNYWTFEPGAAASYLSSKYGFEVTAFTGFDFNTENGATKYHTGDQFFLDGTIAQHLPLFGEFIGAGANGFFYQQITGDGGSGARLGGFEGTTTGVGPEVSYAYQVGDADLAAEVKWLPEIGTSNRLNGDTVWFKLAISWGTKPAEPVEAM